MTQAQQEHIGDVRADGQTAADGNATLVRTLIWVGVAGLSTAIAVAAVRVLLAREPVDPTSRRIQQLIDEANQLLKTLDDQRHTG